MLNTSFNNLDKNMTNYPDNRISYRTQDIYMAIVNAIIPRTPRLAYQYGVVQYYGALDLHIDEYVILMLNSLNIPLAQPIADMLDSVAKNFVSLNPFNQLYTITLLRYLRINLSSLPPPFINDASLVIQATYYLYGLTMMGYYSEWSGYGSTRLAEPNKRKLEYYPLSWKQVGYPGPAMGYRALRIYTFT